MDVVNSTGLFLLVIFIIEQLQETVLHLDAVSVMLRAFLKLRVGVSQIVIFGL